MAIINEAVLQYSVVLKDQALTALSNLQTAVDRINESASKVGTFLTGKDSLKSFFMDSLSSSNNLLNLAKSTGFSTDMLQKWSYAAKSAGVSAESVLSNMKSLKGQWGIGEKDLIRYSRSFQKMGAWGRYQMGSLLGMSEDMISLLSQGPGAVQKWLDEAEKMGAVLPKDEIEKAAEAHKKWETTLESFHKTSEKTLTPFIEYLTKILEKVNEFQKSNPEKTFKLIETSLKVILALNVTSWIADKISKFAQFIKVMKNTGDAINKVQVASQNMGTAFSKSVGEMAEKGGVIGGVGKAIGGLNTVMGTLIGLVSKLSMAWTSFEVGRGLGELLGLGDENTVLGKWFAEAGEDAADFYRDFFGAPKNEFLSLSEEELNRRRKLAGINVSNIGDNKIGQTYNEGANKIGQTLIMPTFDTGRNQTSDFGGDLIATLEKMTLNNTPEGTTAMTAGGNTFIFYNIGEAEMQQIMNMSYGR